MRADNGSIKLVVALGNMTIAALAAIGLWSTRMVLPGGPIDVVVAGSACRVVRTSIELLGLLGLLVTSEYLAGMSLPKSLAPRFCSWQAGISRLPARWEDSARDESCGS